MQKAYLILISVLAVLCAGLSFGAVKSVRTGNGFLFFPSYTPTATLTLTPTMTSTPTLTPTLTAAPTLTATQTESPTLTPTPSTVPTDTAEPTLTPAPTLTPTVTLTPTATFDVEGFIGNFYRDATATAEYQIFLQTPTLTPQIPDELLTSGLMEEDEFGISWVYLRTNPADAPVSSGFWLMQTEASSEMYAACVETGDCQPVLSESHASPDEPVVWVNRSMAERFCNRIGGTLPSFEQWHAAAAVFTEGETVSNYESDHPEAILPEAGTAVGLYGNVWEWTEDGIPVGGAYTTARQDLYRRDSLRVDPAAGAEDIGFRCVRPVGM